MEKIAVIMEKSEFKQALNEFWSEKETSRMEPEFENEKLTREQAIKLTGVSSPTFRKMVRAKIFPEHSLGPRKKFYLKSEIITGLKKQADEKENT